MLKNLIKIFLLTLLTVIPVCLKAQNIIEITDHTKFLNLIPHVEIYTETENLSSFSEIQDFNGFKANSKNIFLDYYNKENLWLKFKIKNSTTSEHKFLLEIPNATINDLTFYKEELPGQYEILKTGASYSFSSRDIKTRYFTFDIEIPQGEVRTYFIQVNTEGDAMNFPLMLWHTVPYINNSIKSRYFLGIYYGSIFFIIVFHSFLFYQFREKALIFYMLYVAGFAGYQLYMDGFASTYILPEFPNIARRSLTMFAYLCFWSMVIFTQVYLNTARIIPAFDKILNIFKWILLAGLLLCLTHYQVFLVMQHFLNFLGPLSTLVVIIAAVLCLKEEPVLSKLMILAFSLLIGGIFLEVTKNTGLVYNPDYALKIGHASEAVVLSFALSVRFKMKSEKMQNLALERLQTLNQLKDQYNAELEKTVSERTAELNKSNKNINDSILYARQIQYSLLPSNSLLMEYIPEHFIFYKPKDIISGDFYWYEKIDNKIIIAVVDCTGHGVPGAFLSMLGSTILRQTVIINKITNPEMILKSMDCEIRTTLKQKQEEPFNKDGMDMGLIVYDLNTCNLHFSGAKRPLIVIKKNKELIFFKGSKHSVGGELFNNNFEKDFYTASIPVQNGDCIYLFTDGIIDQFGGDFNRKFMINKFKNVLLEIQDLPMSQQKLKLKEIIECWQGNQEQVDDILVMGLKF